MLYDPKWNKPKVTVEQLLRPAVFIAWLEKQPANDNYNYADLEGGCLVGLYMSAHGHEWGLSEKTTLKALDKFNPIAACDSHLGWTFGDALARAHKAFP